MGFRPEYETEFSSTKYHLVRNKLAQFLEGVNTPELRLVEMEHNSTTP